jgi:hypothetical protein
MESRPGARLAHAGAAGCGKVAQDNSPIADTSGNLDRTGLSRLDWTTGIPYYMNLKVEWNKTEAKLNYAKHGVIFDLAKEVFDDPFAVEFLDDRQD